MAFVLKHSNKNGTFEIELLRDVSEQEMTELCKLAYNLVPSESYIVEKELNTNGVINQKALGERPVLTIDMGSYIEPTDGVRLKIFNLIKERKITAINFLRKTTGISMFGCKDILFGNYPCPILTEEIAIEILSEFRKLDVFAKVVPANNYNGIVNPLTAPEMAL